ncbi:hypothetical protein AB0E85_29350 [Streptomyces sp. NPDC029044]|uniref:hypothetical protein n=1 Tax=Streptomyces sp. NPDC029044 TaxID=3157198 RepID=UPI0033C2441E
MKWNHQAALAYSKLHREMELPDQLIKRVRVHDTGLFVTTSTSKADRSGKGAGRFIQGRTIAISLTTPVRWPGGFVRKRRVSSSPDQPSASVAATD